VDIEQFGTKKISLDDFNELEESPKILFKKFRELKNGYRKAVGNEAKKLKVEIEKIREKINKRLDVEIYREIKTNNPDFNKEYLSDLKPFHWGFEFYEVFDLDKAKEDRGFDIIVGNPPYIDSEFMTKNLPIERQILKQRYSTAKGNWDLYIPFYQRAYIISKENAIISYITPNKWLSIGYGMELRKFLKKHFSQICDCSNIKVFEEAGNSPVITFINKIKSSKKINIHYFNKDYDINIGKSVSVSLLKDDNWGILLSRYLNTLLKFSSAKQMLSDICDVENPFTVSEAYDIIKYIVDNKNYNKNTYFKFINTGTIDKYVSLWGKKKTSYIKRKYDFPLIIKKPFEQVLPNRYNQSISSKIIISGIRYFECFLDSSGEYVAGKSTIIIRNPKEGYSLKTIIALLNSKIMNFYIKEAYNTLGIDGGINFSSKMVKSLPFIDELKIYQNRFDALVSEIMNLTSDENFPNDTKLQHLVNNLQKEIDVLVYKILKEKYNITQKEIDIIDRY